MSSRSKNTAETRRIDLNSVEENYAFTCLTPIMPILTDRFPTCDFHISGGLLDLRDCNKAFLRMSFHNNN